MKTTKAKSPKTSKVLRKEKGSLFGDHPAPKLPPKKRPEPGAAKQYQQAHLAPRTLKFRKGEI
jgi:hypothetical protein